MYNNINLIFILYYYPLFSGLLFGVCFMKRLYLLILLFELLFAFNCNAQWERVCKNIEDFRVYALEVNSNHFYAGTDSGGVFISTDSRRNWSQKNNGLPMPVVIYSILWNNNILYAGTSKGLYYSLDEGNNWITKDNIIKNTIIKSIIGDYFNLYVATNGSGIFHSTDKGNTWTALNNGLPNLNVNSLWVDKSYIYAGTTGGIFVSFNYGDSGIDFGNNCILPSDIRSLYGFGTTVIAGSRSSGLLISTDYGKNWYQKDWEIINEFTPYTILAAGKYIYAGMIDVSVVRSNVNVDSLEYINSGIGLCSVYSLKCADNNIYAATAFKGVVKLSDKGDNWESSRTGIHDSPIRTLIESDNNILAGSEKYGIFLSDDNGSSWCNKNEGLIDPSILSLSKNGNNLLVGTSSSGAFLSSDNGNNWINKSNGLPTGTQILCTAIKDNILLAGCSNGLYISNNKGENWAYVNIGLTNPSIRIIAVKNEKIFIGTNNDGIFLSIDNGQNWSTKNIGLSNTKIRAIEFSGDNIIVGAYTAVYISTDAGDNWVKTEYPTKPVNSLQVKGNDIFVGSSIAGVYLSKDNGNTWNQFNSGLKNLNINSLAIIGKEIFTGTSDGLFKAKLSDFGISNAKDEKLAENYLRIYPNPTENILTIYLDKTWNESIDMQIFDILGQYVLQNKIPAGVNKWEVNLETLPTGIYFVKCDNNINRIIKL